jgi:hypothetical protein
MPDEFAKRVVAEGPCAQTESCEAADLHRA